MSYEIIYKIFTISKNNNYIPFVVAGSNNCTEMSPNGRERRERNLLIPYSFFNNKKELKSISDMEKNFEKDSIQKNMDGGNIQGKYKTAQSVINAFKKYTFTSQELQMKPELISLYYVKLTDTQKKWVETVFQEQLKDRETVITETEKKEIIDTCFKQFTNEVRHGLDDYYKNRLDWITYIHRENECKIEYAFKQKFKTQRQKPKSTYEINQELKDNEFIEFKQEDIPKIKDRTLLVYDRFKNLLTDKGKIKPLVSGKEHGFFMNRSRRRYLPLYNIHYYKVVN